MLDKFLLWGACPWENDGGAVVAFYQFQQMNYMNPMLEIHAIPKVWSQVNPTALPLVQFHQVKTRYFGQIPQEIPKIMQKHKIKNLILWHIPWEYFPIIDKVHKVGGRVINWQTIHWENDVLFISDKLHDFDWWVPATQYAKDTFVKIGNLDTDKMTVIPHGVDTLLFYPHESTLRKRFWNDKKKIILFTGRCQLTKGIVPLMLCARKLVDEFDCRIIFKAGVHAGVWKSKEIAHLLNKMSGWDNRIIFQPTWTTTSYMEELVAASDIIICPSGHEGSSLTPLEGMACAKPVAVSDIPVHRELIGGKNGECGLLMPTKDHTEYVNDVQSVTVPDKDMVYGTLKFLLENPDEAEAMGKKGLERVKERYDLEKICNQWFELLGKPE